jgi:hypothetical protein
MDTKSRHLQNYGKFIWILSNKFDHKWDHDKSPVKFYIQETNKDQHVAPPPADSHSKNLSKKSGSFRIPKHVSILPRYTVRTINKNFWLSPVKRTVSNDMSNAMSKSKIFDMSSGMSEYMLSAPTVDIYLGMSNNMPCYSALDKNFDMLFLFFEIINKH